MDIHRLNPEYNEFIQKVAQKAPDEIVFGFDDDVGLSVDDLFESTDDGQLYKIAEVEHDPQQEMFVVKATRDFHLSSQEFNEAMHKVAGMSDAETRHSIADAMLAHTLKQVAPEYEYGVNEFLGMGKWYA